MKTNLVLEKIDIERKKIDDRLTYYPVRDPEKREKRELYGCLIDCDNKIRELKGKLEEIQTPKTDEFFEAVKREAQFQKLKWGEDHDAGKNDLDWFWLIGYLAQKAVHKPKKKKHHIITTAAACYQWFERVKDKDKGGMLSKMCQK